MLDSMLLRNLKPKTHFCWQFCMTRSYFLHYTFKFPEKKQGERFGSYEALFSSIFGSHCVIYFPWAVYGALQLSFISYAPCMVKPKKKKRERRDLRHGFLSIYPFFFYIQIIALHIFTSYVWLFGPWALWACGHKKSHWLNKNKSFSLLIYLGEICSIALGFLIYFAKFLGYQQAEILL